MAAQWAGESSRSKACAPKQPVAEGHCDGFWNLRDAQT
jgi:hypothetical protein